MPIKRFLLVLCVLATCAAAPGACAQDAAPEHPLHPIPPGPTVHAGNEAMNGYSLSQFGDFIKDWHLVTVRYRKDTGEMRLTYANPKAWKALQAGGTNYPDGSVFAKIGIMTADDPAFASSVVPSGAKRYQFMVKDAKKHKDMDAWGYALFDMSGKTFEQEPGEMVAACHACHKLVPERDYVFSQTMHLDVGLLAGEVAETTALSRIEFVTKKTGDLPQKLRKAVPPAVKEVRVIEHDIARNLFQGTLDEIRPTLTKEALRARLPAVLMNEEGTRFSMVLPKPKAPACTLPGGKDGVEMLAVYTTKPGPGEVYPVQTLTWCED